MDSRATEPPHVTAMKRVADLERELAKLQDLLKRAKTTQKRITDCELCKEYFLTDRPACLPITGVNIAM